MISPAVSQKLPTLLFKGNDKALRNNLGANLNNRWPSFCLFLEDGRVSIDNAAAARAMCPMGNGRKNTHFAGAHTGAGTLVRAIPLIETAKLNGLDPQAYFADGLDSIHDHNINRNDELLPAGYAADEFIGLTGATP